MSDRVLLWAGAHAVGKKSKSGGNLLVHSYTKLKAEYHILSSTQSVTQSVCVCVCVKGEGEQDSSLSARQGKARCGLPTQQGKMKANSNQRAAAVRRIAAVGSGPRTRLPFLRKVVQDAIRAPYTHQSAMPFTEYSPPSTGGGRQRAIKVLYKDPQCIVVNDAFPKSRLHCLVMPLDLSIDSLNALYAVHVPLLRHMVDVAERYTQFLRTQTPEKGYSSLSVATGFHAIPSLPQLHMHLISMDFDNSCLKTKKHYNSFATQFFLSATDVVEDLEQNGCVTLNQNVGELKRMEEQVPRCLWCGQCEGGMPQLKAHLRVCAKSKAFVGLT